MSIFFTFTLNHKIIINEFKSEKIPVFIRQMPGILTCLFWWKGKWLSARTGSGIFFLPMPRNLRSRLRLMHSQVPHLTDKP